MAEVYLRAGAVVKGQLRGELSGPAGQTARRYRRTASGAKSSRIEQAEDRAGRHPEGDVAQRLDISEALLETFDSDRRVHNAILGKQGTGLRGS